MTFIVTMKDIKKNNQITSDQASDILGLTHVHISRLKHKVLAHGLNSLLRVTKPSVRKTPETILKQIADLYKDFNIMHFKNMLLKNHRIKLSYETIRKTLINYQLHQPIKKKIIQCQKRMSKAEIPLLSP